MATKLPDTLPDCLLLNELSKKTEERKDIDFNFLGKLVDFKAHVSAEVRQINELFPEYTPHDAEYHLNKLFYVADTVLEKKRIESFHSSELFLIALALYGHDWGMAVNEAEKSYILTGNLPEGFREDEIHLLPNERDTFRQFAKKHRLELDEKGSAKEIPLEIWREYVRETHAFRSGERIKKYFKKINGGVAEGCARLCAGHYLDFEQLDNHIAYPVDFSVLGESVNLRACTIYVRLIDLLDLAEDRTPYVIWKFVAPRDPKSKMEWEKHRALQPVTCPKFQEGRVIRVDGSTSDHEVYAALEDLKQWCEDQLRGCNNVLARMNDPRHKLDLYHIEWRVVANGFDPVSMRFEFNRERMFEILGDEIYEGDHYVFLRELLQNSIDAIRMRKEILAKNDMPSEGLGIIKVDVQHGDDGDALVTWTDDGLGMDEYIIRNYLAVAGKSYYRSVDFEREGLNMDPISRFGIGVLSCFMVADRIEIETVKEPYMQPSAKPLKIIIPAMTRQFRAEEISREGKKTGTEFRVYVKGEKMLGEEADKPAVPLDVTKYLSIVAGFVEFPIVVTEGEKKTIILHPRQDVEAAIARFGSDFKIHQLDLTFPWEEAILPQDLQVAHETMKEVSCNINEILGDDGYDGVSVNIVPKDDLELGPGRYRDTEHQILGTDSVDRMFRTSKAWSYFEQDRIEEEEKLCKSATHYVSLTVYRDGILLAEAKMPRSMNKLPKHYRHNRPKLKKTIVNLPKSKTQKVDVARTRLLGNTNWYEPIKLSITASLFDKLFKELPSLDLETRFFRICRLINYFNVDLEDIKMFLPSEKIPIPFIESGGHLSFVEWKDIIGNTIRCCKWFNYYADISISELFKSSSVLKSKYEGMWLKWSGEKILIDCIRNSEWSVEELGYITKYLYENIMAFERVQFLTPPWEYIQPIYINIIDHIGIPKEVGEYESILHKSSSGTDKITIHEINVLRKKNPDMLHMAAFEQPFEEYFAYGRTLVNVHHPATQALLRCFAIAELWGMKGKLKKADLGRFRDKLFKIIGDDRMGDIDYDTFSERMAAFWKIAAELGALSFGSADEFMPGFKDFIPGTIKKYKGDQMSMNNDYEKYKGYKRVKPFGTPLIKKDEERLRKEVEAFYSKKEKE